MNENTADLIDKIISMIKFGIYEEQLLETK